MSTPGSLGSERETHYDTHVVSNLAPVTFSHGELADELKDMDINRGSH